MLSSGKISIGHELNGLGDFIESRIDVVAVQSFDLLVRVVEAFEASNAAFIVI